MHPSVHSLRDVTVEMLTENKGRLTPTIYRRCKYVVEENERVLKSCQALENDDLKAFGSCMIASHEGLSKEYEVSCPELDYLADLTRDHPHVYGARMMGGGFGGCTINLVEKEGVFALTRMIKEKYHERFHIHPAAYLTTISSGTSVVTANEIATV
jgi:galactokinase